MSVTHELKHCRLFHKWGPWKVFSRGTGKIRLSWQQYGSDVEVVRLERFCTRCGDLQLKTVMSS